MLKFNMDWRDRQKFYHLDNFKRSLAVRDQFGVSLFECNNAIIDACEFFGMPLPFKVIDASNVDGLGTCFISTDSTSFDDDILVYNLRELRRMGISGQYALSLIMTHEFGHRFLQNTTLPGLNDGDWEEELCCDFFIGVRIGLEGKLGNQAVDKVCNGLLHTWGCSTHPNGELRVEIIKYGIYSIGNFDMLHKIRRSAEDYFHIFGNWLSLNHQRIQQIQRIVISNNG